MTQHADDGHEHDHDRGLSHDLPRLLSRRGALGLLGGVTLAAVAGVSPRLPRPARSPRRRPVLTQRTAPTARTC